MLRFLTAGESHGPSLTLIVEGLPAGLAIDENKLNYALARRQVGYGRGGRMKIETDKVKVTSGVRFGVTLGSPVSITIENKDWANWQAEMALFGNVCHDKDVNRPRPGHADITGMWKYGFADARPVLERASARKTATRVAVGALAEALLDVLNIRVAAHVRSIGDVKIDDATVPCVDEIFAKAFNSDLFCVCDNTAKNMRDIIDKAKLAGDTLGGVVEVIGENIIPGLGSYVHWDRRIDGIIAQALMSIPAFKAVEFGDGISAASTVGSMVHDEMFPNKNGVARKSNHAGGVEGGMTNGESLVVRGFMKPIPTLMKQLGTIDVTTGKETVAVNERSDTCAVAAASVVAESMVKWVLATAIIEKFSSDTVKDLTSSVEQYKKRISEGGYGPCNL